LWKPIWNAWGTKALQLFLWKACHNILPTRENLYWRYINSDPLYPMCGLHEETVGHAIRHCQSARYVLLEGPKVLQKCTSYDIKLQGAFCHAKEKLDDSTFHLFITIARQIWFKRNSVVHRGEMMAPTTVMKQASEQITNFKKARESHLKAPTYLVQPTREKKWEKPPVNVVKVNWDASISTELNTMGVGVILTDHVGDVIASFCTYKPTVMEPTTAEALVAWYATEICRKLGVKESILEGDAKEVVQALQRVGIWRGSYCMLVKEARINLQQQLEWQANHVFKEPNDTAQINKICNFLKGGETMDLGLPILHPW
jgi:hypothetical protein